MHRQVGGHGLVQVQFDGLQLLGADGLEVGEVEAQALRVHQGAGLLDVVAQMAPQDRLEEMGGGVVGHDAAAPRRVHLPDAPGR